MDLRTYLNRIGIDSQPSRDLEGIAALMQAHVNVVPFENLDVQLGRAITTDIKAAYEKIVTRRRGGWCYEMNGLFGWALSELGFDVTRLGAGVMRQEHGEQVVGNHLCLLVECNGPHLVDVGFGGSLCEPLPLRNCSADNSPYRVSLALVEGKYWRFSETLRNDPFSFDFVSEAADEAQLSRTCQSLQTDPDSSFVLNLVTQMRYRDTHISLRGRLLQIHRPTRTDKQLLNSPEELVESLKTVFDLNVPEIADLWPRISKRHEVVFGDQDPTASLE